MMKISPSDDIITQIEYIKFEEEIERGEKELIVSPYL